MLGRTEAGNVVARALNSERGHSRWGPTIQGDHSGSIHTYACPDCHLGEFDHCALQYIHITLSSVQADKKALNEVA